MCRVDNDGETTGKRPGGVTGKGFRPGRSGNPGGRPKNSPFTEAHRLIAELLVKDLCVSGEDTLPEAIAKVLAHKALKGDIRAAKEIADRVEGTPRQRHELSGPDGAPMQVNAEFNGRELVRKLREIYGLEDPSDAPTEGGAA